MKEGLVANLVRFVLGSLGSLVSMGGVAGPPSRLTPSRPGYGIPSCLQSKSGPFHA
jgi:hypothetical protein